MANPGKVGIVKRDIDAVFASYLVRLSPKDFQINQYYLFYFLSDDRYQGYITGASTGTTRKSASASVLTGIEILIPPKIILSELKYLIQYYRLHINNLLKLNFVLRQTRDILLPRLISGELDVSELDIAMVEENT